MLAPLGFFLYTLFATCALFLLICWVLDADQPGGPGRTRSSGDLGVPRPSLQVEVPFQTAFARKLEIARREQRARLVDTMLVAVAHQRVANRPGRWEPRVRRRRPKEFPFMKQPRSLLRKRLLMEKLPE